MVSPVTDPNLIAQLEAQANANNQPVTDPDLIAKLNGAVGDTSGNGQPQSSFLGEILKAIPWPKGDAGITQAVPAVSSALQFGAKQPLQAASARAQGLYQGAKDLTSGLSQVEMEAGEKLGLIPQGTAAKYTAQKDAENKAFAQTPAGQDYFAQALREVPKAAPFMALSPLMGGEGVGLLSRIARGAGVGAGGSSVQYVPEDGSRLKNTFTGGLLGGAAEALPATSNAVLDAAEKFQNKLANIKSGTLATPEMQELSDLSKKYNVPTMASDISQSPLVKSTGEFLDTVPFLGTKGFRSNQMQASKDAAEQVSDEYGDIMSDTPFGGKTGLNKIQALAKSNDPVRSPQARKLLQEINNSGSDWNNIIQTSGNLKAFRAKLIADRKYDKVSEIADQIPGGVPTKNILSAIDSMASNEKDEVIPNEKVLNLLSKVKSGLTETIPGQPEKTITDPIMGTRVIPATPDRVQPREMNYSQMRKFRSDLGHMISDYYTGENAVVGSKGVGLLQALKRQTEHSMNQFANNSENQNLRTAWRNADNFYRTRVIPYKDKGIAQALTSSEPDTIYSKFIQTGKRVDGKGGDRAQKFYNALDEKGRSAVRYGMVSDAFQKAYKPDTGAFSPAVFSGALDNIKSSTNVFFNTKDLAEIEGFKKLMRNVSRSHLVNNMPETGAKALPYIIGGTALSVSNPFLLLKGAAGSYAVKKLFTTDLGKRILLASSKAPVQSKALDKEAEKFLSQILEGEYIPAQKKIRG